MNNLERKKEKMILQYLLYCFEKEQQRERKSISFTDIPSNIRIDYFDIREWFDDKFKELSKK